MNPERLRKARELFEAAAAETGAAREAVVDRGCNGDADLRGLVQRMIAADGVANAVLDRPLHTATPQASEVLPPGSTVGPYRILREIGSGGMGVVYLAGRDGAAAGELYALKIVRWPSPELSRRFQQEQAILSRLEHPNVARLLDMGKTAGEKPYFVMEYVEGEAIHSYCERMDLTLAERLRLFRQVCAAVRYLHQNLVIHRDLKPVNILVTANGTVKLVDFGIAKLLESTGVLGSSAETTGLMTPDYASPEQVRGGPASTLTDVYALGILLYESLTGANPFAVRGAPVHETLRRICDEEPAKPSATAGRRADRKLRGELDNIILKAIRKEPERRYASVEQFDEDVRRYLAGLPVAAHGDALVYQARKFVSRHKGSAAAAAAMLALLCGGIVATSFEAGVARRERERAEAHARDAERARVAAERERTRAEQQTVTAQRERDTAERRLAELRKLAHGMVRIYSSTADTGRPGDAAALIAQGARDSVLALQAEGTPGLADLLDQTSVTARSFQLAGDATWNVPRGWDAHEMVPHEYRVGTDHQVVHSGKASLFMRSLVAEPAGAAVVSQWFAAEAYRGRRVRMSAFLRSERLAQDAELWLGVNAPAGTEGERVAVRDTTAWKEYEVVMEVPADAGRIGFWLTIRGTGTLWADDFRFERVSSGVPLTKTRRQPENLGFTNSR
jgi:hypothetical protein